jgi:hypothetical protein
MIAAIFAMPLRKNGKTGHASFLQVVLICKKAPFLL